jgi:hypothetical protein
MNITTRTNFLSKNIINGKHELDLGSLDFKDFDFGDVKYYMVSEQDLCRPDLISFKIYGTSNYWWFLMWFNGISDIWNDLREDMVLKYPNIEFVRQAFKLYKKT